MAMPPLFIKVRYDLADIMFDVFGTQRSKQLLQRQRGRVGSLVEVIHLHCGPRCFVSYTIAPCICGMIQPLKRSIFPQDVCDPPVYRRAKYCDVELIPDSSVIPDVCFTPVSRHVQRTSHVHFGPKADMGLRDAAAQCRARLAEAS